MYAAIVAAVGFAWQLNNITSEQEDAKRRDDLILTLIAIEVSADQNSRLKKLEHGHDSIRKAQEQRDKQNKFIMTKLNGVDSDKRP